MDKVIAVIIAAVLVVAYIFKPVACPVDGCEHNAKSKYTCPCCDAVLCNYHWEEAWSKHEYSIEETQIEFFDEGYNVGYDDALEEYGIEE